MEVETSVNGRAIRESYRFTIFVVTTILSFALITLAPIIGHANLFSSNSSSTKDPTSPLTGLALSLIGAVLVLRIYFGCRDQPTGRLKKSRLDRLMISLSIWTRSLLIPLVFFGIAFLAGNILTHYQLPTIHETAQFFKSITTATQSLTPTQLVIAQVFTTLLIIVHLPTGTTFKHLPLGPSFWFWTFALIAFGLFFYSLIEILINSSGSTIDVALNMSIGSFLFWLCFQTLLRIRGRRDEAFRNSLIGASMFFIPTLILISNSPKIPFATCLLFLIATSIHSLFFPQNVTGNGD